MTPDRALNAYVAKLESRVEKLQAHLRDARAENEALLTELKAMRVKAGAK